jgi:predicted dehydrogenase
VTDLRGVMIGAGYFAAFQAEAWRALPGAAITAVADLDPERARAFARTWGIPRAYGDAAEMLERERPDFVDIVTRPESHLALARLAAERGAHVICQKPLAPTWEESLAVEQACRARGVRLIVHENWRWQPWYREARRLIDAGAVGRPFYVSFRMRTGDGRGPEPYTVQPYFRDMPRLLIYETAVHFLDTFRFLAGEIREVFCRTRRLNAAIRGEDFALVQVTFDSGAAGLIDANRIAGPVPAPPAFGVLALEGDEGALRLGEDGRLFVTRYGRAEEEHPFTRPAEGYKGNSIRALQEHIVARLRDGDPAEPEGADYLKTAAAVFACYRSAASGAPVAPGTLFEEAGG